MTAARLGALVVVTLGAAAATAHAQDANRPVVYRVKQGDTLELLAAEFYGDRNKTVFILDENKMTRRPLRPGERLRIPVSREIATSPGDTFESLAIAYLGSGRRSSFLADWNNHSQDDNLPAGTQLTIPFTVTHVAASPESFGELSRMYFGDGRSAEMLRRYNQLEKPAIDRGEQVIVPAYNVRTSPARQPPLEPDARARAGRRSEAMTRAVRALPAARQAWRDGDFAGVKATLAPLEPDLDYLDADMALDTAVLLGAAHAAYNENDLAVACFQHAVDRQHQHALQRRNYSPKILALWKKAGGTIE
ncbi:MAG TPA: LysM peptidoglycan-binding domain-containing protein [Kofleriaceae bacterium]